MDLQDVTMLIKALGYFIVFMIVCLVAIHVFNPNRKKQKEEIYKSTSRENEFLLRKRQIVKS